MLVATSSLFISAYPQMLPGEPPFSTALLCRCG